MPVAPQEPCNMAGSILVQGNEEEPLDTLAATCESPKSAFSCHIAVSRCSPNVASLAAWKAQAACRRLPKSLREFFVIPVGPDWVVTGEVHSLLTLAMFSWVKNTPLLRIVQLEGTYKDHQVKRYWHFRANWKWKHISEGLIQMPSARWQAWDIDHLCRMPVPEFNHPHGRKFFQMSSLNAFLWTTWCLHWVMPIKQGGTALVWQQMENEGRGPFYWLYALSILLLVFVVEMQSRSQTFMSLLMRTTGGRQMCVLPWVLLRVSAFTSSFYGDGYVITGTCFNAQLNTTSWFVLLSPAWFNS